MPRVTRSAPARRQEDALLGRPRQAAFLTAGVVAVTAVVFVLVADHGMLARIQRLDDAWLRLMISGRTPPLTAIAKVFNVLGLVYVTLPVRIALAGFLALRRRWWHLAAFAAAIVLSEVLIGSLKGSYDRARPPGSLVATTGASFPSGHAIAASVTVVAAVIALVPPGRRRVLMGRQFRALALSPFLRQRLTMVTARQRSADLRRLAELIEAGAVTPFIDRTYPLDQVPDAMRYLEAGQARGKVAITI